MAIALELARIGDSALATRVIAAWTLGEWPIALPALTAIHGPHKSHSKMDLKDRSSG
jgi:hypothetical protein